MARADASPPPFPARRARTTPPLPPLRDDLELLAGPPSFDGGPTWTIHDPVRNRFHRIGPRAFDLLSAWHLGDAAAVSAAVERRSGRRPAAAEVRWMETFLRSQSLVRQDAPEDIPRLCRVAEAAKTRWLTWVLHRYLFIRIPLVRPDRFLTAMLPLARPFYTRTAALIVACLGLLGLLLAVRQWPVFTSTFLHFFDAAGLVWYGAALAFAKVLHELGHALTAKRYGCRVPTMGVAFLVLMPVLFTDTTDTWRLPDRRRRLTVGAAGMIAELGLAAIATFLWGFLPDGPARSAAFVVATVTWIMTLAVNLNPFMRFDGYYLLSDLAGIDNLQDRAFAQAKWRLRETLLGLGEPPPEPLPPRLRRFMLVYAYGTWVWRFLLFLGIALLVYHMFFKALGLVLFAIEIGWFIVLPVVRELRVWWDKRTALTVNRHIVASGLVLGLMLLALVLPWQGSVTVPAMQRGTAHAWLFPPVPARVVSVDLTPQARVTEGQVLARLAAPQLDHEIAQSERRIAIRTALVRRQAASDETADNIHVLRHQLISERTRLRGLRERQAQLTVRAPHDGVIGAVADGLRPGRWLPLDAPLALIVDDSALHLVGYVPESGRERLSRGAKGMFYPADPTASPFAVEVVTLADVNADSVEEPALTAPFGGPLAARIADRGRIVPEEGVFRVTLRPLTPRPAPPRALPGTARLEAEAHSPIGHLWRHAWAVLVRESGF